MEIGLGQDGAYDCSGLYIEVLRELGIQVPPELRHTRQMVAALKAVGEVGVPLAQATAADIGNLIFSETVAGNHVIHMSGLWSFTASGRPLVLEAAGGMGEVLVREPPEPREPLRRYMFSAQRLAELATSAMVLETVGSLDC